MSDPEDMVWAVTGPTAGGKSALAMALARHIGGAIINADASQLYADLAIITARPTVADMAAVPHQLYGVLPATAAPGAAEWLAMATDAIAAVRAAGRVPIVVGGTGLYMRVLEHGIAPVPAIDPAVRAAVRDLPPAAAAAALAAEDPAMAARLRPTDRQRIARALEVVRATGRSLAAWQRERAGGLGPRVRGLIVDRPRAELAARADRRLHAMLAAGAVAEAARLAALGLDPSLPVMKALGVRELAAAGAGTMTVQDAFDAALIGTRQYQKRQQTWMRTQLPGWQPIDAETAIAKILTIP